MTVTESDLTMNRIETIDNQMVMGVAKTIIDLDLSYTQVEYLYSETLLTFNELRSVVSKE